MPSSAILSSVYCSWAVTCLLSCDSILSISSPWARSCGGILEILHVIIATSVKTLNILGSVPLPTWYPVAKIGFCQGFLGDTWQEEGAKGGAHFFERWGLVR